MVQLRDQLREMATVLKAAKSALDDGQHDSAGKHLSDLRERISDARDLAATDAETVEQLRARVAEVEKSLAMAPNLVRNKGVYWAKDDRDPWCPNCWEHRQHAVHMNPTAILAGRLCVCAACDYSINLDNVAPPKKWPS